MAVHGGAGTDTIQISATFRTFPGRDGSRSGKEAVPITHFETAVHLNADDFSWGLEEGHEPACASGSIPSDI